MPTRDLIGRILKQPEQVGLESSTAGLQYRIRLLRLIFLVISQQLKAKVTPVLPVLTVRAANLRRTML